MIFRILASLLAVIFFGSFAAAQSKAELNVRMQTALQSNDVDTAFESAEALYEASLKESDLETAGHAAYALASIYLLKNDPAEAAKAYEDCGEHYAAINSMAQALQCDYQSGLSYLSAGKKGTALDAFKSVAKELEKIGQEKSGFASTVYTTLSKEILPPKLDRYKGASKERAASAEYADKAMSALEAVGQSQSETYAAALFLKGLALEDAEKYEEAALVYGAAVDLYQSLPNMSDDILTNAETRLSIARSQSKGADDDDTIDVRDNSGETIALEIKKKRHVKFPRTNKNQMVDGARVRGLITLKDDGSVAEVDILESKPSADFGEAFEKGVLKWKFIPPAGVFAADIPPFEYSMTFFVTRR